MKGANHQRTAKFMLPSANSGFEGSHKGQCDLPRAKWGGRPGRLSQIFTSKKHFSPSCLYAGSHQHAQISSLSLVSFIHLSPSNSFFTEQPE